MRASSTPHDDDKWFALALIVVVLILYSTSINFGLIWDDPSWYRQGEGQTLWQIFSALPTYQFYRPLATSLNRLLVAPSGIVAAQLAHLLQVAAHLLATLAVVPVLRAFKLSTWHARISAITFAIFPFSYQAVAWEAPQQPIATLAVFVAILAADRYLQRTRSIYLINSLAAYAFALFFQESTLPFVFAFFFLAFIRRSEHKRQRGWAWPMLHLLLAIMFFLIWLNVPRQGSITGRGLQTNVLAYVLQAVIFPIASVSATSFTNVPLVGLIALFIVLWLLVTIGMWKWQSGRAALLSTAWTIAGILPIWIGLSWSYVRIGSRLLYPAALGIAILWGGWMAMLVESRSPRRRAIGGFIAIVVIVISIQQWSRFQDLYQTGVQHLDQTIVALSNRPNERYLFVNYPDRIQLRPKPYPLGDWELTLAPVVQNLSDYARVKAGRSASDQSLSAFHVGADQRGAWPYQVLMRGEDSDAAKLFDAASQADWVYLTDYLPNGSLQLRDVGSIQSATTSSAIATFDDSTRLVDAKLSIGDDLKIEMTWQCLKPSNEGDTIFVHVWKDNRFVSAFDGDVLGGLIPLSTCKDTPVITDVRHIPLNGLASGHYDARVGIYNRLDGGRYPAIIASGDRAPDDEVLIRAFDLP